MDQAERSGRGSGARAGRPRWAAPGRGRARAAAGVALLAAATLSGCGEGRGDVLPDEVSLGGFGWAGSSAGRIEGTGLVDGAPAGRGYATAGDLEGHGLALTLTWDIGGRGRESWSEREEARAVLRSIAASAAREAEAAERARAEAAAWRAAERRRREREESDAAARAAALEALREREEGREPEGGAAAGEGGARGAAAEAPAGWAPPLLLPAGIGGGSWIMPGIGVLEIAGESAGERAGEGRGAGGSGEGGEAAAGTGAIGGAGGAVLDRVEGALDDIGAPDWIRGVAVLAIGALILAALAAREAGPVLRWIGRRRARRAAREAERVGRAVRDEGGGEGEGEGEGGR